MYVLISQYRSYLIRIAGEANFTAREIDQVALCTLPVSVLASDRLVAGPHRFLWELDHSK